MFAAGRLDCFATEMLRELPVESVYDVFHWFEKRLRGECRAPAAWRVLHLVFLKQPDAKLEKKPMGCGVLL